MMQTDILASQPVTSSGALQNQAGSNLGRVRVRAIYIVARSEEHTSELQSH